MQQFTLEIIAKVTGVFYAILHKKLLFIKDTVS